MARGKQAAKAANQRADALAEIVASGMADAKMRARQFEKLAARVPGLEEEVRRLRTLNEANTSDVLEGERWKQAEELRAMWRALLSVGTHVVACQEALVAAGADIPSEKRTSLVEACKILSKYASLEVETESGTYRHRHALEDWSRLHRKFRADAADSDSVSA